jgi:hypothetical protein
MDTFLLERFVTRRNTAGEYSASNLLTRFVTRGTYLTITTFFGALLPLFGDFIALTGALAAFSLEVGIVHHMYLKVSTRSSMQSALTYVTSHPYNVCGLNVTKECTSMCKMRLDYVHINYCHSVVNTIGSAYVIV